MKFTWIQSKGKWNFREIIYFFQMMVWFLMFFEDSFSAKKYRADLWPPISPIGNMGGIRNIRTQDLVYGDTKDSKLSSGIRKRNRFWAVSGQLEAWDCSSIACTVQICIFRWYTSSRNPVRTCTAFLVHAGINGWKFAGFRSSPVFFVTGCRLSQTVTNHFSYCLLVTNCH